MFICKICSRQFSSIPQLASHLSNPKSSCKCNIKEYYDKYLKKENDGICKYCGNETSFYGLAKGYPSDKCKHCRNKGKETKEKRAQTYERKKEQKKLDDGYYNNLPIECKMCFERFKTIQGLSKHIGLKHKDIDIKTYYDNYLKKENEGICPITGNKTNFKSLNDGYYKYYGKGTCSIDEKIKNKKIHTLIKNHGVNNASKVNEKNRIKHLKETLNKKRQLKNKRIELLNILRKLSIDKKNKLQCQICGLIFDKHNSLSLHLKSHNITVKEYYNFFFKKNTEGICPCSKKETDFISFKKGYRKYKENYHNDSKIIDNIKKGLTKNLRKKILKTAYKYNINIINIEELNKITDKIDLQCRKCGNIYKNSFYNLQLGYGKCPKCYPRNTHSSFGEKELLDFLKENYNGIIYNNYYDLIKNDTGKKLEIDIYLPNEKIAIEFNGLYWHSECVVNNPEKYHIYKTNECEKIDVQLIHIFEDEWRDKKDIVKKMILHKTNSSTKSTIYARNCFVKEIEPSLKNKFLDENHIQGKDSSKIKLGLFTKENNQLVSVMTFSGKNLSKGTINLKDGDWELNRFATDLNFRIIGAAGKLLKYFQKNYVWLSIFSYADLRYSNGNLYYKLGFKKLSQTLPNYWYVDNQGRRYYRFSLRKRPDEPKDIPEWVLRHNEGYYRIWDCGHLKFILTRE